MSSKYHFLFFNLYDFIDVKTDVFNNFSCFFTNILKNDIEIINNNIEISKLNSLRDLFIDINLQKKNELLYIVIDNIVNISLLNYVKKQIKKVMEILFNIENVFVIFVSNFNLKCSELNSIINLDSFIDFHFNYNKDIFYKEIILKRYTFENNEEINPNQLLNLSYNNLTGYILSINEFLYNYGKIIQKYNKKLNEFKLNPLKKYESLYDLNKYQNINIDTLKRIVKNQIENSLFNIKQVDNFSQISNLCKNKEFRSVNIFKNIINDQSSKISNISNDKKNNFMVSSDEILYDSLSKTQCLMLLACFLASELSPNCDFKNFKNMKKTKRQKGLKSKKGSFKSINSFTYNRVIGIYNSLYGYFFLDKKLHELNFIDIDYNISDWILNKDTILDLNSLIDIDLIKILKTNEQSFILSRKMVIKFDIKFISRVMMKLNAKLNEFINID